MICSETKTSWHSKKMELKSEAIGGVSKNFKKLSVSESRESGKGDFLWILRSFQEHLFCRTSVNAYLREMKQFDINISTENHQWWCSLKYNCRFEGLEHGCFLIKLAKFCRASVLHNTTYYWATASDFQQHFWRIAFFISNTLIKSKQIV